jgi:hypothetical protein
MSTDSLKFLESEGLLFFNFFFFIIKHFIICYNTLPKESKIAKYNPYLSWLKLQKEHYYLHTRKITEYKCNRLKCKRKRCAIS